MGGRSGSGSGRSTCTPLGDGDAARLRGVARATEALGSELLVHVEVPAEPVLTEEIREVAGDVDAAALERLESEAEGRRTLLVARLLTQERPVLDTPIDIGVDTRRLHFFDLDGGSRDLRLTSAKLVPA